MAVEATVLPALITAGAAFAVSIVSWLSSRSNQQKVIENQVELQRYQKDLRRLQAELDEKRAERDARRDYEYEALKRLYQECSPLLFQLSEQASSAYGRIRGISESAAQGNLGPGPDSWLTSDRYRYYRASTEYRLLAPLATLKLLQQRLTRLDMSLDPEIQLIYTLARQAGRVISDDFELARVTSPELAYEPHTTEVELLRSSSPAMYWQQGVPRGILDSAVETLLVKDGEESRRVMSFLEFEAARKQVDNVAGKALERIGYLFVNFHPKERPILWRILLATASIYRSIGLLAEREHSRQGQPDTEHLLLMSDEESNAFDWRADKSNEPQGQEVCAASLAVRAYLMRELQNPVSRTLTTIAMRSSAKGDASGPQN